MWWSGVLVLWHARIMKGPVGLAVFTRRKTQAEAPDLQYPVHGAWRRLRCGSAAPTHRTARQGSGRLADGRGRCVLASQQERCLGSVAPHRTLTHHAPSCPPHARSTPSCWTGLIFIAVLLQSPLPRPLQASRDYMMRKRGIREPEMVVGVSAHAAYFKVGVGGEREGGWQA